MDWIIGAVVIFIVIGLVASNKGNSKTGGCTVCGGALVPTSAPGYSYRCRDCSNRFV